MNCPKCEIELTILGCCVTSGMPFHWCPSCGAIKPCGEEIVFPANAVVQSEPRKFETKLNAGG